MSGETAVGPGALRATSADWRRIRMAKLCAVGMRPAMVAGMSFVSSLQNG